MKKYLKKIVIGASFTFTGLVGLLILFVLYPNNLFANRTTYATFNIYSSEPLEGDHHAVLDKALALVKGSELYNSDYQYDIFLTSGTAYKTISFKLIGPALARSLDNNIMLNIDADFRENLLTGPANKRDLARTIAHEMVHCLQMHRYGMWRFNPANHPPLWKLEGYPEYIAHLDEIRAPGYEFVKMVSKLLQLGRESAQWVELQPGHFDPIVYFRGRVLIEYLMEVKGMRYDEILNEGVEEREVYSEVLRWWETRADKVQA